jgi:general secretion pathway protein G
MKNFTKSKGFTLIEILIVVLIIGVVVAVVGRNISGGSEATKIGLAKADMNGNVKTQVFAAVARAVTSSPNEVNAALDRIHPKDPWGSEYTKVYKDGSVTISVTNLPVSINPAEVPDVVFSVKDWLPQ